MTQTHPQTPDDWLELAPHTYVRSTPGWGMNSGLVIGRERALLVDTGAGPAQAKALLDGIRKLTDLPVIAVNAHAHFDH